MNNGPCPSCPFARAGPEREALMEQMILGAWIPCRLTAAPPTHMLHHDDRIAAWNAEQECVGARLWRREQVLPLANVGPETVNEKVAVLCAQLRVQVRRCGPFRVSRATGMTWDTVKKAISETPQPDPHLGTVVAIATSVGLELKLRQVGQ